MGAASTVAPLRGVRFFLDGTFLYPLSPRTLYLALWCIPELLHMTRISDPQISAEEYSIQGTVIIAESHVNIVQKYEAGKYHGWFSISTCAPERLDEDVLVNYATDILHFRPTRTWAREWETE
jgi:hypothetical protein